MDEQNYITLFLNSAFSEEAPLSALTLFFLFLARMYPIIALSPFFGAKVLPHPVKAAFVICLFSIFLPKLLIVTTSALTFDLRAVFLLTKEVFIGYTIGILISLPFIIAQNAGIIVDHQRGGASLMVNDPTVQNQSSPLGTLFNMVLIFLFYYLDAPFMILDLISDSYDVMPPDKFLNPNFFNLNTDFWKMQINILNKVMVVSIQLATPALILMLMTDLFLGIANRLAPQVQITFLGMGLKSLLGLAIVAIGWNLIVEEFGKSVYYWVNQIGEVFKMITAAQRIP
ncbi:MAG: EscT/YscT/HrcT family type III secretion system export apparatus protein [Parachlamydiaceae bacterium]